MQRRASPIATIDDREHRRENNGSFHLERRSHCLVVGEGSVRPMPSCGASHHNRAGLDGLKVVISDAVIDLRSKGGHGCRPYDGIFILRPRCSRGLWRRHLFWYHRRSLDDPVSELGVFGKR
jgi:hypothetical protein